MPKDYANSLEEHFIYSNQVPYLFNPYSTSKKTDAGMHDLQFVYPIYMFNKGFVNPPDIIAPIIDVIKPGVILRAKVNLTPSTETSTAQSMHRDYEGELVGATPKIGIYYVNSCDGGTQIGDQYVEAVKNRLVLFDDQPHFGYTHTNTKVKVIVNILYIADVNSLSA